MKNITLLVLTFDVALYFLYKITITGITNKFCIAYKLIKTSIASSMTKHFFLAATFTLAITTFVTAQKQNQNNNTVTTKHDSIPLSHADLGIFPYFKTLPNFRPLNSSDSVTIENNRTYFFDGKKYFSVDGQVSSQKINIVDNTQKIPSEFQLTQEFDKVVFTLGGVKIFSGKLPEDDIKRFAGQDMVELSSRNQVANSAYYGVTEYVIKTPDKEVWIQLVAATIASKFYTLMVVEKQTPLINLNTNKINTILKQLEANAKAVIHLDFEADDVTLFTQSKDELLEIVGIFQAHPDWKISLEIHNAPVAKPEYTLALTEKRAAAIKEQLISLGVKSTSVNVKGLGDTKPLVANDTEKGRLTNTRVEISKL